MHELRLDIGMQLGPWGRKFLSGSVKTCLGGRARVPALLRPTGVAMAKKIFVTISGGCAYVIEDSVPQGFEVEIIDFDTIAGLLDLDPARRSESQAGQYSSRSHQSSLSTRAICDPPLYFEARSIRH